MFETINNVKLDADEKINAIDKLQNSVKKRKSIIITNLTTKRHKK